MVAWVEEGRVRIPIFEEKGGSYFKENHLAAQAQEKKESESDWAFFSAAGDVMMFVLEERKRDGSKHLLERKGVR